jgi:hypothetical protein
VLLGWIYSDPGANLSVARATGQPHYGACSLSLSQAEVLGCLRECLQQQKERSDEAEQVRHVLISEGFMDVVVDRCR